MLIKVRRIYIDVVNVAVLQAILGVKVTWKDVDRIPDERHVIVSNHVTTGDMMALYRLPKRTVHLISSQLPDRIARVRQQHCSSMCTLM